MPQFGEVIGRYVTAQVDGPDGDQLPELVPLQGTITFTLATTRVVETDVPQIILSTPITAVLDSSGYLSTPVPGSLTDAAYPGIKLVATDSTDINPTGLQYRVEYKLTYNGVALTLAGHNMALPAGSVIDLALITPVEGAPVQGVPAAEASAAAAVAAANSAARVVIVTTGSEARPAGALVVIWVDLRVSPTGNPANSTTNDIVLRPI